MHQLEERAISSLRMLSVDMINQANSGHPGLPLGAAPMAHTLFTRVMRQNPADPSWSNRDRFVLSAGHGSALLYSLLHISGYPLPMDELKRFRQFGSKTPGHPEVKHTEGVEATTGPLGQGFAMAVGMAMAERHQAALYNTEKFPVVDHFTYFLCGDGDLMEGVAQEAASLAGHLGLGKLIGLYDSNRISLDGPLDLSFSEHVHDRFQALGWQVLTVTDGNDPDAIEKALLEAQKEQAKPTLIEVKTIIGYGAPKEGTAAVHGAPIGPEGREALAKRLGWDQEAFSVPEEVYALYRDRVGQRGKEAEEAWKQMMVDYRRAEAEKAAAFDQAFAEALPVGWAEDLPVYEEGDKAQATRAISHEVIQGIARALPQFWGGSADLSGSNKTNISESGRFVIDSDRDRNIYYGVREFAMAAINNGIALHGGSKIFGATFFVFSDYMRGAVRLSALMKVPCIYVMTHDSVAVGEDGPTHEPIEQLAAWRAMVNLDLIRPADGNETTQAWICAVESKDRPTMLALSRQNLPILPGSKEKAKEGVKRGAYVLSEAQGQAQGILIGTGSEVQLCLEAQKKLWEEGIDVRVVSMPSFARFEDQSKEYQEAVLPPSIRRRVSVEAGTSFGWARYVGSEGISLAIDRFGLSAPAEEVLKELGMSAEHVVNAYKKAYQESK